MPQIHQASHPFSRTRPNAMIAFRRSQGIGMAAAAFGYLTPVQGALIQEAIDVAVILNALRALRIKPQAHAAPTALASAHRAEAYPNGAIS